MKKENKLKLDTLKVNSFVTSDNLDNYLISEGSPRVTSVLQPATSGVACSTTPMAGCGL